MRLENVVFNEERNVTMTAFIQNIGGEFKKLQKRPAILILPGGGYSICSDREAEHVAFAYAKAGYQTFVLRYSVREHKTWPNPLNDYEKAMEFIKSKCDEWHIYEDKIAVLGFSAGGHLAACAATMGKNRPNVAILGYAALSQETADMCQLGMPEPIQEVDENTCPCFLFSTRDDSVVPISDTVRFQMALIKGNISFESHIYAYGPHGFSTGEASINNTENSCDRVSNWIQDSIEWLKDMLGDFVEGEMTSPSCASKVNGDKEPYLSVTCTIAHLKVQAPEVLVILAPIFQKLDVVLASFKKEGEDNNPFIDRFLLKDVLEMLKVPPNEILKIEEKLSKVPNIK